MYALHQQANLFSWISFSSHPLSHKRARSKDTILSYVLTFSLNIHGSYLFLCIHFRQEQNATANDEFCSWKFAIKIFPFTLGRTISQRCISSCWFIFQFICTALDKYHFLWIRHFPLCLTLCRWRNKWTEHGSQSFHSVAVRKTHLRLFNFNTFYTHLHNIGLLSTLWNLSIDLSN